MKNRRGAHRHNLALPIVLAELPRKTHVIHGTTRNISTHGLYFTTDLPVAAGRSLEFSFTLPENEESHVTVAGRARVMRVEEQGSDSDKVGIAVAIQSFTMSMLPPPIR